MPSRGEASCAPRPSPNAKCSTLKPRYTATPRHSASGIAGGRRSANTRSGRATAAERTRYRPRGPLIPHPLEEAAVAPFWGIDAGMVSDLHLLRRGILSTRWYEIACKLYTCFVDKRKTRASAVERGHAGRWHGACKARRRSPRDVSVPRVVRVWSACQSPRSLVMINSSSSHSIAAAASPSGRPCRCHCSPPIPSRSAS